MKRIVKAGLLCSLLSVAVTGQAQEKSDTGKKEMRPYISEMYTYTFENNKRRGTEGGHGGMLSFGAAVNEHWGLEVGAFHGQFPHDDKVVVGPPVGFAHHAQSETGGKVDALYFYSRNPEFSPYFSVGGGGIYTKLRGTQGDKSEGFYDVGVGFMKFFRVWETDLGFRAEARYRQIFFDDGALGEQVDGISEGQLKIGLVIPINIKKDEVAPPVVPKGPCADSDGDGVCDTADLCPGTPKGTVVDAKGCPKEEAEDAKKKFDDVYFAFDKSDVGDSEKAKLDGAATIIGGLSKKYPGLKVDVSGHTDWVGTDGYNQGLSERRANSVKSYLVRKGVDAGRINTFAFGESKPAASNETAAGRARNRRAEVQAHE